jgi:hypothetical protein
MYRQGSDKWGFPVIFYHVSPWRFVIKDENPHEWVVLTIEPDVYPNNMGPWRGVEGVSEIALDPPFTIGDIVRHKAYKTQTARLRPVDTNKGRRKEMVSSSCCLVGRLEAGDVILALTSYTKGNVQVRVVRGGKALQWVHSRDGFQFEGCFDGISCSTELGRTLKAVANFSGCTGVVEHPLDEELKSEGWVAFRLVQ